MDASRPDGEALLAAVAHHRDRAAFARLFAWFAPRVKGQLMAAGLDAARAEDLTQDVMLNVWRKAHLYDATRGAASTWVYAMTRNRFLNVVRRQAGPGPDRFAELTDIAGETAGRGDPSSSRVSRPTPATATFGADAPPEHLVLQAEREQELREALAELPAEQREALRGAYFSGQSLREVADGQNLPLGTLKTRVRLAIEKLRKTVKNGWQS